LTSLPDAAAFSDATPDAVIPPNQSSPSAPKRGEARHAHPGDDPPRERRRAGEGVRATTGVPHHGEPVDAQAPVGPLDVHV
jgi:hypothetical protein